MATALTLRSEKGSELTHAEVDANFTALRTTADRADWSFAQSRWQCNDFTANTSAQGLVPFAFTATSSGTLTNTAGLSPGQYGAVAIRDSTTAGGGGTLEQSVPLFADAGYAYRAIFRTAGVATATARLGSSNSFSTALGNNFAFLEIVGTTGTFRARRNASGDAEVVDDTTTTLVANTDYVLDIDWTSATTIRFVLWEFNTGTVLRSWTATTAEWPNPGSSSIRFGARATESTTGAAADILVIDYMGFGPSRPGSLAVPV